MMNMRADTLLTSVYIKLRSDVETVLAIKTAVSSSVLSLGNYLDKSFKATYSITNTKASMTSSIY